MVVAQLLVGSLPTLENRGSNPFVAYIHLLPIAFQVCKRRGVIFCVEKKLALHGSQYGSISTQLILRLILF